MPKRRGIRDLESGDAPAVERTLFNQDGIHGTNGVHPPKEGESRVEELNGLAPFKPIDTANPYPRPCYFMWDAPVWRIMSSNRTIVCSTQSEAVAAEIAAAMNDGRLKL